MSPKRTKSKSASRVKSAIQPASGASSAIVREEPINMRVMKVKMVGLHTSNKYLTVREFEPNTRALIPPEKHIDLINDEGEFPTKIGCVYALMYYFIGPKGASVEITVRSETQKQSEDPLTTLLHKDTIIKSNLGFNQGYCQVPDKGVVK